jgi:enoyl-CoA hydratase/3-hydroxyacyl-CoA dehydrogenase
MSFKTITYDKADGVGTVRLNRPDKLNAMNFEMLQELWALLQEVLLDQEVRVVLLTGEGRYFSAGADLEILSTLEPEGLRQALTRYWNPVFSEFENMPKLTIAGLSGPAVGAGVELVLCCDLRYAAANATLRLPQINFGILPDAGATVRLPMMVGRAKAKELILKGDILSAQEAAAMGLINGVFPREGFAEEVSKIARELAQKPPLALGEGKQLIERAFRSSDTRAGLEEVMDAQCSLIGTEDYREGIKAFFEKRNPVFRGK